MAEAEGEGQCEEGHLQCLASRMEGMGGMGGMGRKEMGGGLGWSRYNAESISRAEQSRAEQSRAGEQSRAAGTSWLSE